MKWCLFLSLVLLSLSSHAAATPDRAALKTLKLPQAHINSTQWLAAGDKLALWSGGQPVAMPKGFCRVRGKAMPVPGSVIGFEVWLPATSEWNGKFMQAGNGGTAGAIPLHSLMDGVNRGYATAATDGGHVWPDGLDYGWASNRPEAVVDFGWRAVQRTSQVAQRIVRRAMGRAPARLYFVGCSDGGRDAMMAAQRLPQDFDGIVAGAPALAWLDLMIGGALLQRQLAPPVSALPVAKLPALQTAAVAACGNGRGFIDKPQQCRFDHAVLACNGVETDQCLTPTQIAAVREVYAGPRDPLSGRRLAGLEPGAEADPGNWDFWLLRSPTNPLGGADKKEHTSINERFFRHLVRDDPAFVLADLTDADIAQARQRWSATLDATNADLRAFQRRGGKLLQYHGWSDAAIPPRMSLDYHAAVQRMAGGDSSGFHRLFMVPGMNHCGGGAGPWQVDWLAVLERWVERGEAPTVLTARQPKDGATQELRSHGMR
jgi:Tannase and feruloyl esterase